MTNRNLLIILTCFLMSACATGPTGKAFQPENLPPLKKQTTQFVIYRKKAFEFPCVPMIKIDSIDRCELPGGSFIVVETAAQDKSTVAAVMSDIDFSGTSEYSFKTKPMQRYFVRIDLFNEANTGAAFGAIGGAIGAMLDDTPAHSGPFIIRTITEDMAVQEMVGTKQSEVCPD